MRVVQKKTGSDTKTDLSGGKGARAREALMDAGFEVEKSLDDLMAGHFHMKTTGKYVHEWGIGRHLLGSQLYDYWRDPAGFILEHWTDGDLLTADQAPQDVSIVDVIKGQYGPIPYSSFNMPLPTQALDEFRQTVPGLTEMLITAEQTDKDN